MRNKKVRVAIGAPTYNDHERIRNLWTSIFTFTDFSCIGGEENVGFVMLDDGTPDKSHVEKLREMGEEFNIPLIENEKNMGIPHAWNRLTEYYDADIVILCNDDVMINNENWLKALVYVFENNENIGSIGFNLIQIDPKTNKLNSNYTLPNYDVPVGRVGSPVGCCFGFLKKNWAKVSIDRTVGFPESVIRSFYEETWFNFEQWKQGLMSCHVPYPAFEHYGSQTFGNNTCLSTTEFNEHMSKDEYLIILKQHPEKLALSIDQHKELAEKGLAYRMDYSRCLFAKFWRCRDYWSAPQVEVHEQLVNTVPRRMIKYLDKNMNECEVMA